ncbi:MAG: hypothetical protein OXQ29_18055 [Rhodospirillaceae bacterium]|nr:hypothetical protein [Rhodospirillaceae bacterium]
MSQQSVIRRDELKLELVLSEATKPLGFATVAPGLSDQSNRVTVAWIGVDGGRLAWEVQLILPTKEFGTALAEVFTAAWNAVAEDQRFTPDATSVGVSYSEVPTGGTKQKNYVSFTVLGSNIDARGV